MGRRVRRGGPRPAGAKGCTAIEVQSPDRLVETIDALTAMGASGQLDNAIAAASMKVMKPPKRRAA
jgi:hypothetical protein